MVAGSSRSTLTSPTRRSRNSRSLISLVESRTTFTVDGMPPTRRTSSSGIVPLPSITTVPKGIGKTRSNSKQMKIITAAPIICSRRLRLRRAAYIFKRFQCLQDKRSWVCLRAASGSKCGLECVFSEISCAANGLKPSVCRLWLYSPERVSSKCVCDI